MFRCFVQLALGGLLFGISACGSDAKKYGIVAPGGQGTVGGTTSPPRAKADAAAMAGGKNPTDGGLDGGFKFDGLSAAPDGPQKFDAVGVGNDAAGFQIDATGARLDGPRIQFDSSARPPDSHGADGLGRRDAAP